jgi:urease accessory protein
MPRPSRLPILLTALTPLAVSAHPLGAHTATLFDGLLHPVTGLDHTLAMIAVGLAASRIRERGWIAPASFMASMLVGLAVGALGLVVPFTESAIVVSVLLFGLIVGRRGELPLTPVALTFGAFALFHGMAHGHEANGVGFDYASGVLLATGALHALGFGLARLLVRSWGKDRVRWAGVPVTLGGLALLIGG